MSDIKKLQETVVEFRDARDWGQFHNTKDTAISLVLEATEFLEHFQWKSEKEIQDHLKNRKNDVSDELADVLYWVLLIANDLEIPLDKALKDKMVKNDKKYPVSKSKGSHAKYTEL